VQVAVHDFVTGVAVWALKHAEDGGRLMVVSITLVRLAPRSAENTLGFFDVKGATVPAAVSVFPRELYQAPRSWAEKASPNLIYFIEVNKGNHFAAWQEPKILIQELRAASRSLARRSS
jgi:hypothetical protein